MRSFFCAMQKRGHSTKMVFINFRNLGTRPEPDFPVSPGYQMLPSIVQRRVICPFLRSHAPVQTARGRSWRIWMPRPNTWNTPVVQWQVWVVVSKASLRKRMSKTGKLIVPWGVWTSFVLRSAERCEEATPHIFWDTPIINHCFWMFSVRSWKEIVFWWVRMESYGVISFMTFLPSVSHWK